MSSCSSTAASHVFIDLATFSELEGFLYGGPEAITHFVRSVQKSNWFSFIPIQLRQQGALNFGQKNACASVNRSGDYVLNIWFRCRIPQIQLGADEDEDIFADATIRWTRNLMHNLWEKVSITFNELTVQEFTNFWLDFNFQFRTRGSKRVGYRNIIGDIAAMTTPVLKGVPLGTGGFFSTIFPFWFSEDSGIALPIAALPFNDVKVNYCFRRLEELIFIYPGTDTQAGNRTARLSDVEVVGQPGKTPELEECQTWSHYAVVHNDERVKMGDAPRDMLIHQIQDAQVAPFKDVTTSSSFDIRLSHSIVMFAFAARNNTYLGDMSNYTTESTDVINVAGTGASGGNGLDPIAFTQLVYENTCRLAMGSDYYSLIHPFLYSDAVPDETGYHMWSYALHPWTQNPSGSTNFSKLANVSIIHTMSPAAIAAAAAVPVDSAGNQIFFVDAAGAAVLRPQTFEHIFCAKNWNIARVANGSLGHPTL